MSGDNKQDEPEGEYERGYADGHHEATEFCLRATKYPVTPSDATMRAAEKLEGDKATRRLTLPELNHLSALLEAERESGSYAGPREQYYARTERLIKWCRDQIGDKTNGTA